MEKGMALPKPDHRLGRRIQQFSGRNSDRICSPARLTPKKPEQSPN